MAVRGVASFLTIYPQLYTPATTPLYRLQNYFPSPTVNGGATYSHRSFTLSTLTSDKNSTSHDFSITFPATVENVDLVDACLSNRYTIIAAIYRWSATEGLEAPSTFNLFASANGEATTATADITSVTLSVRPYADTINADMPWRKIPWTILGPLSLNA